MERRNYRKVFARLWTNPNFHALDERGKLVALYLLAGPQTNRIGLFRVSVAQAVEDLDIAGDAFRVALCCVCAAFGWRWDQRASVLWIASWWAYNAPGENDKAWKGALTDLNDVPRTSLADVFLSDLVVRRPACSAIADKWRPALTPDRLESPDSKSRVESGTGIPNTDRSSQELERKQEQEQRTENAAAPRVSLSPAAPDPFVDPTTTDRAAQFIERYQALYPKHRKGARYFLKPARDYQAAVQLCATWTDDARLDKLAVIFLTTDHKFAEEGSRTIPQFAALASWCDGKLAEWETKQGVA